ncbi:tRNA1(Val) (adenine(37)-N6)-methyltransferase [Jannaschia sp. 2305UL9-9]|uniref:tRNA1(Val) (adenine(37)-N6)-methyltransferase n=1 Tax=Jannaschia sp. 2305UL9-9 TaxID=3121638 RepID=UPI003526DF41
MTTLTRDAFLGGRLTLWQPRAGFRAGSDAVLLAAAIGARAGHSVLDLGCGVGAAMYCLECRVPGLVLTGVEAHGPTAELARRNGQAEVVEGDVLDLPADLRQRQWTHVIANPPYFPAGAGSPAGQAAREAGLREGAPGDLSRWAEVACRRVAPKGSVTLIARADRLSDLLAPMDKALGGIAILPISSGPDRPAGRVIVQGRKGARAALRLLPPLVLHADGASGAYRPEAEAVLRNMQSLALG